MAFQNPPLAVCWGMIIREMVAQDWPAVADIFNQGLKNRDCDIPNRSANL